jgi:hypothetical protein
VPASEYVLSKPDVGVFPKCELVVKAFFPQPNVPMTLEATHPRLGRCHVTASRVPALEPPFGSADQSVRGQLVVGVRDLAHDLSALLRAHPGDELAHAVLEPDARRVAD